MALESETPSKNFLFKSFDRVGAAAVGGEDRFGSKGPEIIAFQIKHQGKKLIDNFPDVNNGVDDVNVDVQCDDSEGETSRAAFLLANQTLRFFTNCGSVVFVI